MDLGSGPLGEATEAPCPLDPWPLGTKKWGMDLDQGPLGVLTKELRVEN